MTDKTEQKFLDAALKLFAEEGYIGTTTMSIAEEAGFSEKTLFRKFKTKENLFNRVMDQNNERLREEFNSVLIDKKFKDPEDFLETLIKNLAKLTDNNYEFFSLSANERKKISKPITEEFTSVLGKYLEKNMTNKEVDYQIFAMNILAFIYMINDEKYYRGASFKYKKVLEKFISNSVHCIRSNYCLILPFLLFGPGIRVFNYDIFSYSIDTGSLVTILFKLGTLFAN